MKQRTIEINVDENTEKELEKIIKRNKIHGIIFLISYFLILLVLCTTFRNIGISLDEEFIFGELYLVSCVITYHLLSKLNKYILKSNLNKLLNIEKIIEEEGK